MVNVYTEMVQKTCTIRLVLYHRKIMLEKTHWKTYTIVKIVLSNVY